MKIYKIVRNLTLWVCLGININCSNEVKNNKSMKLEKIWSSKTLFLPLLLLSSSISADSKINNNKNDNYRQSEDNIIKVFNDHLCPLLYNDACSQSEVCFNKFLNVFECGIELVNMMDDIPKNCSFEDILTHNKDNIVQEKSLNCSFALYSCFNSKKCLDKYEILQDDLFETTEKYLPFIMFPFYTKKDILLGGLWIFMRMFTDKSFNLYGLDIAQVKLNAADYLKNYSYIEYFHDVYIGIDFSTFPKLDPKNYNSRAMLTIAKKECEIMDNRKLETTEENINLHRNKLLEILMHLDTSIFELNCTGKSEENELEGKDQSNL